MRGFLFKRSISSFKFKHNFLFIQRKPFCNNTKNPTNNEVDKISDGSNSLTKYDAYKEVQNLDFMKASKILFSDPPKQKKFGLIRFFYDPPQQRIFGLHFHLVQLFFVCLPSLAVYLLAQYARPEMRRADAEWEQKKIAEEEAKAKEMLKFAEEAATANPEYIEVKERLEKLEETVKDIVVETKKRSSNLEDKSKLENSKQEPTPTKPNNSPDNKHSSSASTTKTSSKAESDVSTRDVDSRSNRSSHKKI